MSTTSTSQTCWTDGGGKGGSVKRKLNDKERDFVIRHLANQTLTKHSFGESILKPVDSPLIQMICNRCGKSLFVDEIGTAMGSAVNNFCPGREEKENEQGDQ